MSVVLLPSTLHINKIEEGGNPMPIYSSTYGQMGIGIY